MTVLLLIVWLVLTRAGSRTQIWPGGELRRGEPATDRLGIDPTAVSLEAGVSALALMLIPWAVFSGSFAAWEVLGWLALWPFILRLAIDRLLKLRAGHLAEATGEALIVPGLPRRRVRWDAIASVERRMVRFGPDDVVIRAGALWPVVLDTQFGDLDEDGVASWVVAATERHVG